MKRSKRTTVHSVVALAGLMTSGAPALAEDCNAKLNAQQLSVEEGESTSPHTGNRLVKWRLEQTSRQICDGDVQPFTVRR